MFDILYVRPGWPLARIITRVGRMPTQRVAIVVAPDSTSPLSSQADLESLAHALADRGKHITVVGGTTWLRAWAVSAGLAAASTVEDWRAGADAPQRATWRPATHDAVLDTRLVLLDSAPEVDAHNADGDATLDGDLLDALDALPAYLHVLLDGAHAGIAAAQGRPPSAGPEATTARRRTTTMTRAPAPTFERIIARCECDEERISDTIAGRDDA